MQLHTTIRSWGALALGMFFAAVTARTIFDDVWNGAPVTIAHSQSLAALVAAIATGHMILPQVKSGRVFSAFNLALVFCAATFYIVVSAGARNAEVGQAKSVAASATNDQRDAAKRHAAEAEAEVSQARETLRAATAAAAKECATGKKTRCDGRTETRDNAARELDKAETYAMMQRARLDVLHPVADPQSGIRHAAQVFEAMGLVSNAQSAERKISLLLPFAVVLLTELATLTFIGLALGHGQTAQIRTDLPVKHTDQQTDYPDLPVQSATVIRGYFGVEPDNDPDPKPTKRMSKPSALSDLKARLDRGETVPSYETLAKAWGDIPKQTVSDWMASWIEGGDIPPSIRVGRCKAIVAA